MSLGYLNWLLKKIIFRNIRNSFRMTRFHERVRPSDAKSTAKKVKGILAWEYLVRFILQWFNLDKERKTGQISCRDKSFKSLFWGFWVKLRKRAKANVSKANKIVRAKLTFFLVSAYAYAYPYFADVLNCLCLCLCLCLYLCPSETSPKQPRRQRLTRTSKSKILN